MVKCKIKNLETGNIYHMGVTASEKKWRLWKDFGDLDGQPWNIIIAQWEGKISGVILEYMFIVCMHMERFME